MTTQFPGRRRVLILTASIGAGHEASAAAIAAILRAEGHEVIQRDGLRAMSERLGSTVESGYGFLLRWLPWLYDVIFWISGRLPVAALLRWLTGRLHGPKIAALVEAEGADLVIATYPLVSIALGRMVRANVLHIPLIAVCSDFGAHPLWVAPEADLHLVPALAAARLVERAGGVARAVRFPVSPTFATSIDRTAARTQLGLAEDAVIPLIVGGAWGVGDLAGVVDQALAAGACPIVVAGRNAQLLDRLQRRFGREPRVTILGWTDRMPTLMAAADCLIQNAGGMTCLEAMTVGLPIVIYRPIPGHGRLNARLMASSGAAVWARSDKALRELLRGPALPAPIMDGSTHLGDLTAVRRIRPLNQPRQRLPQRRFAGALLTAWLLLWLAVSPFPAQLAAARVEMPVVETNSTHARVVVVRTDAPEVAYALEMAIANEHLPAALFVTQDASSGLVPMTGVTIGVAQDHFHLRLLRIRSVWTHTRSTAAAIEQATGMVPTYLLPASGRPGFIDYGLALAYGGLIMPSADSQTGIDLIDTTGMTPEQAVAAVLAACPPGGTLCQPLDTSS